MSATAALLALLLSATAAERASAPPDGWAAQDGGTRGGALAEPANVYTVRNREQLVQALAAPAPARIVRVASTIDMSEGRAFSDSADQSRRGTVRIPSNTTMIGVDAGAGFINASLQVANASQVVIRNLVLRNPCDANPVWDPRDGTKGNWNSLFDAISVSGSHHVWIDHNSFTDAPDTDDTRPVEHGMPKQCHDGALDITQGSDFVSVTYNHFSLHQKNTLIGSSDRTASDAGRLRVTFKGNLFEHVSERAPRVRYGQVHLLNNYYVGDRKHPAYKYNYSVGAAFQSKIVSDANAFDIAGVDSCAQVVRDPAASPGVFRDRGSLLNGKPLAGCPFGGDAGQVPYTFQPLPAREVAAHVLARAGPIFAAPIPMVLPPAALSPRHAQRGVPPDTPLRILFDAPPSLGGSGSIRVYRRSDRAIVAVLRTGENTVSLGPAGRQRIVRRHAVEVVGNTLEARLPSQLDHDTEYDVAVDAAIAHGSIGGKRFDGARWHFRTTAYRPVGDSVTVDDDGRADFRTVQGGLDYAMALPRATPVTVNVRAGLYPELLYLRAKDQVTVRGASAETTIIRAANSTGRNPGSGTGQEPGTPGALGGRALFLVEDSDLLELRDLAIHNTARRGDGEPAQAEALYFNNDRGRLLVRNARFTSEQDTLQLTGYAWFHQALIEGNVDFIWGHNRAALFEDSEIRSVGDSAHPERGGYLVQARSVAAADPGFVFLRSRLTRGPGPAGNLPPDASAWLARSPGRAHMWDNVAYIDCIAGPHIAQPGWLSTPAPNPARASALSGWREHGNKRSDGSAASFGGYVLSDSEAVRLRRRSHIFAGYGGGTGWNPQP